MIDTLFPVISWEEISKNEEPDTFEDLFYEYLLPKLEDADTKWCADTVVTEDNINLLYYASKKITSISLEEQLRDKEYIHLLLDVLRIAYLFAVKKQYKEGLFILNWIKVDGYIKFMDEKDSPKKDSIVLFATVLYYFLKEKETKLTVEDIHLFSKITYSNLDEFVHFGIESDIFNTLWNTDMRIGTFYGWAFYVIETHLTQMMAALDTTAEKIIEEYLTGFISLIYIFGINEDALLKEQLEKFYQYLMHPFLPRTCGFLQAEHRNMDSISKYISGIRKDTPKRYRPILEEQLNSLFEYLKEPKDYVELLNDINKKSHLIPCLHMTQEKENERFFLFSDTLENLVRKNDENSCLLALDIYNKWLSPALQEKALQEEPFYMAYVFSATGHHIQAKELYEKLYEEDAGNTSVLNNLAVIYYEQLKDYKRALELLEQAKNIKLDNEFVNRNIEKVLSLIEEEQKRPKEITNRYFKKINKLHRKILFAIHRLSDEEKVTDELLQSVTKLNDLRYYQSNINKLLELELIVNDNEKGYVLDPIVHNLIQDYVNPKMEREIVRASSNCFYRPIFYHESEIRLYQALIELFPQQLVFPNMDLKTVIDVEKVKNYLEPDILDYMYKAHVDFAIISNTTYLPILCIEKDSAFQDDDYGAQNAVKKNMIFNVSGLPLIRIRFTTAMDHDRLKEEVKQATKEFLLQIKIDGDTRDVLKEFDLKRFGVFTDLPNLIEIQRCWKEVVGDMVYEETKAIQLDEEKSILTIHLNKNIEKVIELGREATKSKLYQLLPMLNSVQFVFI
ncbi:MULTISPECIES: DUF2726 domain-containing protein [Bacillus cereus group]|uniref:DUF2726 domain-containing protein n=1 Tax=Bacillus cereus group TaxID=86661 RepID=UPI0022E8240C|nr:DUF2726 domain-containing protein [Bacillus cereus group sp. BY105LC]MDA1887240.1 DUF2726 domain-containing protein [Bacillus cereus group sp. BY105LC]